MNASSGRSCRRTIVPCSSPSATIKRASTSLTGLSPSSGSAVSALSKAVQVSFFKKCGVSNAVTAAERACLERMKAEGVRVSVEYVLDVMRQAEMAAAYNAAICEAQARVSPVFYLWYEDLLAQPDRVFEELQRFIGVEPRPLRSTAQRIVSKGAASWISNLDEVRAAATALRGGKAALEDGRCKKS